MFTRQEYLATSHDEDGRSNAHRRYHAQFVNPSVIARVVAHIGAHNLRASRDPHFNDIPLSRWDGVARNLGPLAVSFASLGDFATIAGLVCVAKEAARQFVEGSR